MKLPKRVLLTKSRRLPTGAVLVETAISIGFFLILIFSFMDLGIHLYRQVSLQFIVNHTTRWASIGDVQFISGGTRIQRVGTYTVSRIHDEILRQGQLYGVPIQPNQIVLESVCDAANPGCTVSALGTIPGDSMFRLAVNQGNRRILGFFNLSMRASALGLSEG